jgi:hypothetical protein
MRLTGSVTIPRRPSSIGGLISWARGVNRALAELRDRKIVGTPVNHNTNSQPPFYPTLSGGGTGGYKLTMKKGWVSSTHWKYGAQSVVTIEVTGIPGDPDPVANALSVSVGTKVWATLSESVQGEITAAVISSGTSWPESEAAKLIGGDDDEGETGARNVRLCEVVDVDGSVKVKVIHTGNIEHSAATLVENTTNSLGTNEARSLKQWNATAGRWDLRVLKGTGGAEVSEDGDYILISGAGISSPSHPWKVTDGGGGNAAIAAGFINGYYLPFSGFSDVFDGGFEGPDSIVAGPSAKYSGGTAAITGTQYIYALIPRSFPDALYGGNQDVENPSDPGFTGGQEIHNHNALDPGGFTTGAPADTATIAVSSDSPDVYDPGEDSAARCIAKVTNTAGTITVDAQYITHNPDMFVPLVKGVWAYYTP